MSTRETDTNRTSQPRRRLDLATDHWATMARTADLVRMLTALADRYDGCHDEDDARTTEQQVLSARLREVAEAGRLLLSSTTSPSVEAGSPVVSGQQRADRARSRDLQAARRDATAEVRDLRARERDGRVRAVADDADGDFPSRFLAACDRDDAAGDRAASLADRRAAAEDRAAAAAQGGLVLDEQPRSYSLIARLEERSKVRQAQGVLMQHAGISAGEALALMLASTGPMTLEEVAEYVLEHAEAPAGGDLG